MSSHTSGAAMPPDDENLADIVALASTGDRQAFNVLVGYFQGAVYGVAVRILGDRELAADATQDAILSAYRHMSSYHGPSFRLWILRIVTNQCLDLLRARRRRPTVSLDALLAPTGDETGDAAAQPADDTWDPARRAEQRELATLIQQGLLTLPEDQRIALVLCDVEGLSYEEIAVVTQTQLGTIKSRIARGRAKLRDFLDQHRELLPRVYRRAPLGDPPVSPKDGG